MRAYVVRRLLLSVVVLALISVGVFWLLRLGPGDIAEIALGQGASQEQVGAMREHLGLNERADPIREAQRVIVSKDPPMLNTFSGYDYNRRWDYVKGYDPAMRSLALFSGDFWLNK